MTQSNIIDMLMTMGYSSEHFSKQYSVQINGTSVIKFDFVAFADRYQKDISTSCIAIQEVINNEDEKTFIEGAKYLATPILIISKFDRVRVWGISSHKEQLLQDNDKNIIYLYFEKNRFEFMSENLIEAKMGYKQLSIFEAAGLIDFSREATCKILSEEFEKGLVAAKKHLKKHKINVDSQVLNNITSITIHVISALIINSKIGLKSEIPDVFDLIKDLTHKYKDYFDESLLFKYGRELVRTIFDSLNTSINYQSVDHELLGYFYESTLLQQESNNERLKDIRKEFGIYYTPRWLSQEIVSNLPFERIPFNERIVLDGTCGSGSLLLSACKRLEDLIKFEKKDFERHHYLTEMIEGYDIDSFASEVARLSFLLYGLPYGNKWNIRSGNLLRINKEKVKIPLIILGNPPYEEKRRDHQKLQKANSFLDLYLNWLHEDGYIGIVLPASFLQNDSSMSQRKKILNEFDVLELWLLPGHVFENNCSTTVLIAQKRKTKCKNLTKVRMMMKNKSSINKYTAFGKWDFEFFDSLQSHWMDGDKYTIRLSPVGNILKKIVKGKETLNSITKNVTGIMMPSDFDFCLEQTSNDVPYIMNANNFNKYVLSQQMRDNIVFFNYHMSEEKEIEIRKTYRGLRLRKNYEDLYISPNKILVKMSSTPGEMECVSALVDENGYYPSHSFFVIVSVDKRISNYVLCALINSKLINAFVRSACVKRTLTTDVIRNIPVPKFSDEHINKIEQLFFSIKNAYSLNNYELICEIQKKIDKLIYEVFELTKDECAQIEKLFTNDSSFEYEEPLENFGDDKFTNVSGLVESVDIDGMYCNVYLTEFGKKQIKIEKTMPGWFLRQGVEFSAKFLKGHLYHIRPLVYSYLHDEEVVAILNNSFSKSE